MITATPAAAANKANRHKNALSHSRAYNYRQRGQFHSRLVGYSAKNKSISKLLPLCAQKAWLDKKDDLKATRGNQADSALFVPSGFNIHYSYDLPREEQVSGEPVKRYVYGSGVGGPGAGPTGLDLHTLVVHKMTPELIRLCNEVTRVLAAASPEWAKWLAKYPINGVAIKVYYEYEKFGKKHKKQLNWHNDILYHKGIPKTTNTQVPGSPVTLLTYGSTKNLGFQQHKECPKNDKKTATHKSTEEELRARVVRKDSTIKIIQNSGTMVVLDGRDEKPDEHGWRWKHMSHMVEAGGITYTFTFRSLQSWAQFNPDGAFYQPKITSNQEKKMQKSKAMQIFSQPWYIEASEDLELRMAEFLYLREFQQLRQLEKQRRELERKRRRHLQYLRRKLKQQAKLSNNQLPK